MYCQVCKVQATLRCSACSSVPYCSRECQKIDWVTHKTLCVKPPTTSKANLTEATLVPIWGLNLKDPRILKHVIDPDLAASAPYHISKLNMIFIGKNPLSDRNNAMTYKEYIQHLFFLHEFEAKALEPYLKDPLSLYKVTVFMRLNGLSSLPKTCIKAVKLLSKIKDGEGFGNLSKSAEPVLERSNLFNDTNTDHLFGVAFEDVEYASIIQALCQSGDSAPIFAKYFGNELSKSASPVLVNKYKKALLEP